MAITLSDSDAAKVRAGRRATRPSFYSATRQAEQQISEDFEAFLILSPSSVKTQGVTWISTFASMQQPDVTRGALLKEWVENEQADATAMYQITNASLIAFQKWRDNFSAGKFGGTAEVGAVVSDLSYLIEDIVFRAGLHEHSVVVSKIQSAKIANGQKDESYIKQSQSWSGPLLAY